MRSRETNVHLFLASAKSFFFFFQFQPHSREPSTEPKHLAFPFISLPSNNMPSFRLTPLPTSLSLILQWAPNVSPPTHTSKHYFSFFSNKVWNPFYNKDIHAPFTLLHLIHPELTAIVQQHEDDYFLIIAGNSAADSDQTQ